MEINLGVIVNSIETLKKVASQPVAAKTAFKIGKVIKAINQEMEVFEETRQKLFTTYGTEEDGQMVVSKDKQDGFMKEFDELLNSKVTVEIPKISIDDLEKINLSATEINSIEFILKDEE